MLRDADELLARPAAPAPAETDLRRRPAPPPPADEAARRNNAAEFLSLVLWANFASFFCLSNVQSLYPKLASVRDLSPQLIGCLLFMVGAAQSAFFIVLRATRAWHFRYGPLVAVHGLAAAGC